MSDRRAHQPGEPPPIDPAPYWREDMRAALAVPPELAGVSWYGPDGTYSGEVTAACPSEGVDLEMLRRHLIALGATAAFGGTVTGSVS